jgi:hypothetical protein
VARRVDEIDKELVAFGGLFGFDIEDIFIRELGMERNSSRLDCDTSFLQLVALVAGYLLVGAGVELSLGTYRPDSSTFQKGVG